MTEEDIFTQEVLEQLSLQPAGTALSWFWLSKTNPVMIQQDQHTALAGLGWRICWVSKLMITRWKCESQCVVLVHSQCWGLTVSPNGCRSSLQYWEGTLEQGIVGGFHFLMVLTGMPQPWSDYSLISCTQLYRRRRRRNLQLCHLTLVLECWRFFSFKNNNLIVTCRSHPAGLSPMCQSEDDSYLGFVSQVQKWSRCISTDQTLQPRSCKYQVPSSLLSHDRPADPVISLSLSYCINPSIVIEG